MTLLVRRLTLTLLLFGVLGAITTVAVVGYVSIRAMDAPGAAAASAEASTTAAPAPSGAASAKLLAERVLFVGIVCAGFVVVISLAVAHRAFRLTGLLDRLVQMNRLTGFSADVALNRLGDVGRKISQLYAQTLTLSERKSRRISALHSLVTILLAEADDMVVVADVAGRVAYVSRSLVERLKVGANAVTGQHLDELIPDVDAAGVLREMTRTRTPVARERKGDRISFRPVVDADGQLTFVIATLSRSVTEDIRRAVEAQPEGSPAAARAPAPAKGLIGRFLAGRSSNRRRGRPDGAGPRSR